MRRLTHSFRRFLSSVLCGLIVLSSVAVSPAPAAAATKEAFLWPSADYLTMSSPYCSWRAYNNSSHSGIDIPTGKTPGKLARAAKSGVVTFVGLGSASAGNYVEINHGDGTTTRYLHLARVDVKSGWKVSQGNTIGVIGDTGSPGRIHLHFEIYSANPTVGKSVWGKTTLSSNPLSTGKHKFENGSGWTIDGRSWTWGDLVDKNGYWAAKVAGTQYVYSVGAVPPLPPVDPPAPLPQPAAIVNLSALNVAVGGTVRAEWPASSDAVSYDVGLRCAADPGRNVTRATTARSATFQLPAPGSYTIEVRAKNRDGKLATSSTISKSVVAHTDRMVTFVDHDETLLASMTVPYGGTVKPPIAPVRVGYSFQSWDKSLANVTANLTVRPEYLINSYTVRFFGHAGQIMNTQKVRHGSAAVLPPDPPAPAGFEFVGWDTGDHANVLEPLDVNAVFARTHPELPIELAVVSAARDAQANGYVATLRLQNLDPAIVRGKIIVGLKTGAGKLVDSGIETFSLAGSAATTRTVYIPYEGVASKLDVTVVGVAAGNNTGAPLAEMRSVNVQLGENWSAWGEELPPAGYESEQRTEYRTRDRFTASSSVNTMTGWSLTGSTFVWGSWSAWSKTQPAASANREISTRSVETKHYKTQYHYGRFWWNSYQNTSANPKSGYTNVWEDTWRDYQFVLDTDFGGGSYKYRDPYDASYKRYWYRSPHANYSPATRQVYSGSTYHTEWQYRDKVFTYWFDRWDDWGAWSATPATATASRQVETRPAYRFKNSGTTRLVYNYKRYRYQNMVNGTFYHTYSASWPDSQGWPGEWQYDKRYTEHSVVATSPEGIVLYGTPAEPWYSASVNTEGSITSYTSQETLEDSLGQSLILTGTVDAPGRLVTLMVFKGANVDPTASQLEYVAQSQVDTSGAYAFAFTPREDPSLTTGDLFAMIGVEGADKPIIVGSFEAPRPTYTVQFVDPDGELIDKQIVSEGESASSPEPPAVQGARFIGWSEGTTNVRDDMTVVARYAKERYVVALVNWETGTATILEREHGDALDAPPAEEVRGRDFAGWRNDSGQLVDKVEGNLILSAEYVKKNHKVTFVDESGQVIETKTVPDGEMATPPAGYGDTEESVPEPAQVAGPRVSSLTSEGPTGDPWERFVGWSDESELESVTRDMVVAPVFGVFEQADAPVASVSEGAYSAPQTIELTCATSGAVIVYTLDGTIPEYFGAEQASETVGVIYEAGTGIVVDRDALLRARAYADGLNPSPALELEYLIREPVGISATPNDALLGSVQGGGVVPKGITATVTALPSPDAYFVCWQEDVATVSTDAAYGFIADSARAFTAVFAPKHLVELAVEAPSTGSVIGGGRFAPGEAASVLAVPALGYVFDCWLENGVPVSSEAQYGFDVEGERSLTARFEPLVSAFATDAKSTYLDKALIGVGTQAGTLGVASVSYKLNDEPTVTVSASGATVRAEKAGANTLRVWATDLAGNVGRVAEVGFTIQKSTSVTLSGPSAPPAYGSQAVLQAKARVTADGVPLASGTMILQRQSGSSWVEVGRASIDAAGSATFKTVPYSASRTVYRAVAAQALPYLGSTSAPLAVAPLAYVGNPAAPASAVAKRAVSVSGYLKPRHSAGTSPVRIYRERLVSGKWVSSGYVLAKASNYSTYTKYTASVAFPSAGKWRVRAMHAADSGHATSWSTGYDYVTVK